MSRRTSPAVAALLGLLALAGCDSFEDRKSVV